jgi:hypothetical protein
MEEGVLQESQRPGKEAPCDNFKRMSRETPPASQEFELSVIGPGRGECVLLHLGYNEWCVIDSCTSSSANLPAAVEYLSILGKDSVEGVRLLIATHWHDDHIKGISAALRQFSNAKFCCSAALQPDQFVELVELTAESMPGNSGLEEFRAIYDVLEERNGQNRERRFVSPIFAIVNRELLRLDRVHEDENSRVVALSPSDGTFRESLRWISSLMPKLGEAQRPIANVTPNTTSVVIVATAGRHSALLGADLEFSSRSGEGWSAVLESHPSPGRSGSFKVPHHGSPNADCPEVWTKMLHENPIAVVTPFAPSGLPKPDDFSRIAARTPHIYCTSAGRRRPPRRDLVDKLLRGRERFAIDARLGHVRVRAPLLAEGPAVVELFNGAFRYVPSSV